MDSSYADVSGTRAIACPWKPGVTDRNFKIVAD
jgi:hypothetical protein